MKILLVEDDESISQMLEKSFKSQLYLVDVAANGQEGLELAEAFEYDLIVLDIMLPGVNGLSFCKQRRTQGDTTPIIFLTSQEDSAHKVLGLDAGADDYVVKPFNLNELLSRIRALLRRGNVREAPVIEWRDLRLDPIRCDVTYGKKLLSLTAKEYALLDLFLRNKKRIFSHKSLIEYLWSGDKSPSDNTVRSHIKTLRRKLKQAGATDLIETIYSFGYRLKSPNIVKNSQEKRNTTNKPSIDLQSIEKELDYSQNPLDTSAIWDKFKDKYTERIGLIEEAVECLQKGSLSKKLRQQVLQETHTLIGSLGSFGFDTASELAREIQQIFKAEDLNQDYVETLSHLIDLIYQELKLPMQVPQCQIPCLPSIKSTKLLVIEDDAGLAEQIVVDASSWGIQAESALDLTQARDAIAQNRPDIVLLDLNFPNTNESGFSLLAELKTYQPPIPVLVFTSRNSFSDRVKVSQLGGRGFLQKPISSGQVIEAITQFLQHVAPPEAKLLIVDDDPQVLSLLRILLEPWGFHLTLLSDPLKFWTALEQTIPDLLILDLEMPNISGIELCRVIRNDLRWQDLPLLVLSAHTDAATIQSVFTAGADDYVAKPIVGVELIARVLNRLERSQALRKLAEVDMLTGVANRRKGVQEVNRLLRQAEMEQKTLCFAILDLDHFKQINDQHGHEAGDRVLAKLGEQLKYSFSSEDIVARWGGEEFVIVLYNATEEEGAELIGHFLANFYQQQFFDHQQQMFQVSFSAGVAEFPKHGDDLQSLYQMADRGLFEAKAAGRNQIAVAVVES